MGKPERRKKMFQLYSEQLFDSLDAAQGVKPMLRLGGPVSEGGKVVEDSTVICPLCKEAFHLFDPTEDPINITDDQNDQGLTIEHVPPKCLGGQNLLETLTCNNCNSEHGRLEWRAEKHFKEKLMLEEEGKTVGRLSFGDRTKEIAVEINVEGNRVDQRIIRDESRTNINAISEFFEHIEEGGKYKVTHREYIGLTGEQRTALYKSAYLTMFYAFGYPYILGNSTDPIEEEINSPQQEVIPDMGIIPMNGVPKGFEPPTISWLVEPIKAQYVILPIETDSVSKPYGVILPGPEDGPEVFVDKIRELSPELLRDSFIFNGLYNVPKRNTLKLTEDLGFAAGHVLWERYTSRS